MTCWRASRRAARPAALKAAALSVALCVAGAACAQVAEPFQISTTIGYDFADFAASTPSGGLIGGVLVLPDDVPPRAAAILSHGAAGPGARQERVAELLAENGVAALIIDHFAARGVSSVAQDQLRVPEQQMAADIFSAREAMSARLGLDPSVIGAVGWSKGATAVALAAVERLGGFVGASGAPLAFAAAFYPFCGFQLDEEALASPLLLLLAERDDWTPAAPCVRQAEAWAVAGQPVTWRVYEGASHGFDSGAGRFRSEGAITVRDDSFRCTLEVDEAGRTRTVDGDHALGTVEGRRDFLAACGVRGVTFEGDAEAGESARRHLLLFIEEALR
jgi:dienelactone hydrolase